MKKDKVQEALGLLKEEHIAEAAGYRRKPAWGWLPAVAAVVAIAILAGALAYPWTDPNLNVPSNPSHSSGSSIPGTTATPTNSSANSIPSMTTIPTSPTTIPPVTNPVQNWQRPRSISAADYSRHDSGAYTTSTRDLSRQLAGFFQSSMAQILGEANGENQAYSPLNLYLALSLLGELTGGDHQILQALGASDLNTLRSRGSLAWNASYRDREDKTLLANSIWLREGITYNQEIMDSLAEHYFTSSFQAEFGLPETDRAVADWVNDQTGGLLSEYTEGIRLDANTIFALYSTVYYRAMWTDGFFSQQNTQAVFHGTQDATVTFMNQKHMATSFYQGDGYSAVGLSLKDGSTMWMILPEAGSSPEALLENGECMTMFLDHKAWTGSREEVLVNLSVPKFDISCDGKLDEALQTLGITNIFDKDQAPFSQFLQLHENDGAVWVSEIYQATRVAIDEEGVTAASYISVVAPGDSMPPEKVVDFVLDRPFLFVITNWCDLPLFAGVVNDLS